MSEGSIHAQVDEGIALITIDRPSKRNALTEEMIATLLEWYKRCDKDPAIRCVIITGEGDTAFCAGHDLSAVAKGDLGHLYEERHMRVFVGPRDIRKPVIAAVNGAAYAGGLCIALSSDLRLATPATTFAIPAARLGVVPIAGQSSRLPHMLPPAIVSEMSFLGIPLDAARAERFGFVNAVVPREMLVDRALEMGRKIVASSATSIQSAKRIIQTSLYQNVPAADAMEYWLSMSAGHGPDLPEGLAAFADRRQPVFGNSAE